MTTANTGPLPVAHKTASPQKFSQKMMMAALITIVTANVAFWYYRIHLAPRPAPAVKAELPLETVALDPLTVNLAESESFLRVGVVLVLAPVAAGDPLGDHVAAAHSAATRDAILSALAASHADELVTAEGKSALKQRLRQAVAQREPRLDVRDVFFTEFLIQR